MLRFAASSPGPVLVTVPNVPLMSVGMDFHISTGIITVTAEDLADAVTAANGDPAIRMPRLKLGHTDPRFNDEAVFDANPAFGVAANLRLGDNDQTIYCDYLGVPKWLADIMPTAYPSRSVEGYQEVETVTGKKWKTVITDVALLGVTWPGIGLLEDLPMMYGAEKPENVVVLDLGGEPMKIAAAGSGIAAAVNTDDVRRQFYDSVATAENGRYWWWIRAMYLDPNELIVDDDDGNLYRMSFVVKGDEVEFGEPQKVKVQYVDVPETKQDKVAASALVVAGMNTLRAPAQIAATYASRALSRVNATQEGGSSLTREQLIQSLGLPADATDEQIQAAVASTLTASQPEPAPAAPTAPAPTTPTTPTPAPATPATPATPETPQPTTAPATPEQPAQPAQPTGGVQASGVVSIDPAALDQLKAQAAMGVAARQQQLTDARETALRAAMEVGKFPPHRIEHYRTLWNADPEGTVQLLASMAEGLVPVGELGVGGGTDATTEAYPASWFPELAASNGGQPARVVFEIPLPAGAVQGGVS